MTTPRPVAFYAPLKSPNHPSPSGDRTMARLLMKAIDGAGFTPTLASELRTFDKAGDPGAQDNARQRSAEEAARLVAEYRAQPKALRPCLWFTYHVYYKAPDWIGPAVADALRIPYVVAEGSRAAKRAEGPWALGHRGAEAALDRADAILVMTAHDRAALSASRPPRQRLIDLPPFLDLAEWPEQAALPKSCEPRLLAVAMMRDGDKLASYRLLADALRRIQHRAWTLDIVGDGGVRGKVEELFASFGPRIRFRGQIDGKPALTDLYEQADLLVWPAVNEAYGMVLLEAQAFGCPVVAGDEGGVASVVRSGHTGVLTPAGDPGAFAETVSKLLDDRARLQQLGAAARDFVREERTLGHASERLRGALGSLILERGA